MVTIKDVASKAGVSISTTSYALNNSSRVSEKTKARILKVAQELDFHPNGTARNLKMQKTNTIGFFVNDLGGPFYSELIQGVQEIASSNGYDLIICGNYGQNDSTVNKFLMGRRVDGAIILAPGISDDILLKVAKSNFPIIVLDRDLKAECIYSVLIDNEKGAYEAVNHLVGQGYHHILYLSGPDDSYDNKKRFYGYLRTLEANSIVYDEKWYIKGKFTEQSGYNAVTKLIETGNIPEAIFSANDEMAIGAIRALENKGYKVPEDVAIVGFDDIRLSSYIQPKLTTVKHPKYELGILASHMLFRALKGEEVIQSVVLSTDLVIRESCGEKLK